MLNSVSVGVLLATGVLGAGSPPVPPIPPLPAVAPRVAISQAYYSVGDATYVTALAASSTNKTLPFPSTVIPSSSVGHVSIKHAAITTNSPPLLIEALSGTPTSVKVYVSYDSADGSAGSGTWTDESAYFPIFSSSSNTWTRGQRYFWRTNAEHVTAGITGATVNGERWERVEYTTAGNTVNPCVAASSGEWYWFCGMSIVRNMLSGTSWLTTINSFKVAVPGSDPFLFVSAITGANAASIKTAQVDVVAASSMYPRFIRGTYLNPWVNELANSGNRPYSGLTVQNVTDMKARLTACFTGIKAIVPAAPLVAPMVGYGRYQTPASYSPDLIVANAVEDANGNDKFIPAFTEVLRAQSPASIDARYDWPWEDDFSWMALFYDTDLADDIHPNTPGYAKIRGASTPTAGYAWPLYQLIAGATPTAVNWAQKLITELGATPTVARKARALEVFDFLDQRGYPTVNATAITNRAAFRATIAALPTS